MPLQLIQPLGDGRFKTPNGIFNSYAEAAMSVGQGGEMGRTPMSPAMSQPSIDTKLNNAANPNANMYSDASIMSSPAMPPKRPAPAGLMSSMGEQKTPVPTPAPAKEESFMDKLMSARGIGAISNAYLAASQDPALQQMGITGLDRMREQKAKTTAMNKSVEFLRKAGIPENQLEMLASDPALLREAVKGIYKQQSGGDVPADLQTFVSLAEKAGLNKDEIAKAVRVKFGLDPRAASSLSITPEMLFNRAFMTEGGKGAATEELESAKNQSQREAGMRMFDYGLTNLEETLLGTSTGYLAGFLPAMTENAQLAEQAVSLMAPILKQTFRASGEGVFTDKDQELLLGMLPNRGTNPAAIQDAIKNIRTLVEFKLKAGGSVNIEELMNRFGISTGSTSGSGTEGGGSGFSIKNVK